ncbi:hypothetical protein TNCV_4928481 [Trichonephila clavipes]|nr:hypothetical protein TNCV_4928481 [Trichonephila clavipes]
MEQWATILFTDESRFSLTSYSSSTFIWREPPLPALQCARNRSLLQSRLDAVSRHHLYGRTHLHVFKRKTVTA